MHQLQLRLTKLVPCGVATAIFEFYWPCSRNVRTCKRFGGKTDELNKGKGFKRKEIVNLVLTKSMRSIQSDVNKNLALTIKN